MNYFLIYHGEGGFEIKQFPHDSHLEEYLNDFCCDEEAFFLSEFPEYTEDIPLYSYAIIEGNIKIPKLVTMAKSWSI